MMGMDKGVSDVDGVGGAGVWVVVANLSEIS